MFIDFLGEVRARDVVATTTMNMKMMVMESGMDGCTSNRE